MKRELHRPRGDGFDEDALGEFVAEREPGVANEADHVDAGGEQSDHLIFAESNLTQPVGDIGIRRELADTHCDTDFYAVQRTEFAALRFHAFT